MTITTTTDDYSFQMLMYGYHVTGGCGDVAAMSAEIREHANEKMCCMLHGSVGWDWDVEYLATVRINGEAPSEKFALWWVCEHQRRMEDGAQ